MARSFNKEELLHEQSRLKYILGIIKSLQVELRETERSIEVLSQEHLWLSEYKAREEELLSQLTRMEKYLNEFEVSNNMNECVYGPPEEDMNLSKILQSDIII